MSKFCRCTVLYGVSRTSVILRFVPSSDIGANRHTLSTLAIRLRSKRHRVHSMCFPALLIDYCICSPMCETNRRRFKTVLRDLTQSLVGAQADSCIIFRRLLADDSTNLQGICIINQYPLLTFTSLPISAELHHRRELALVLLSETCRVWGSMGAIVITPCRTLADMQEVVFSLLEKIRLALSILSTLPCSDPSIQERYCTHPISSCIWHVYVNRLLEALCSIPAEFYPSINSMDAGLAPMFPVDVTLTLTSDHSIIPDIMSLFAPPNLLQSSVLLADVPCSAPPTIDMFSLRFVKKRRI